MKGNREKKEFLEFLFRKNYDRIFEYCYYKLGPPPQDAEDCAMEVFFRAFGNLDDLILHPCPERWLYVTARNVAFETMRKRGREKEVELMGYGEDSGRYSGQNTVEEMIFTQREEEENERNLERQLLDSLKLDELRLYQLLVKEQKKTGQIAEQLSISYTNATTKVYRLRKKLKKQLALLKKTKEKEGKSIDGT